MRSQAIRPAFAASGEGAHLALTGALGILTLAEARTALAEWPKQAGSRSLDVAGLNSLDTPGALFLCGLRDTGVKLKGVRAEHKALLELISNLDLKPLPKLAAVPRWRALVIELGKRAEGVWRETLDVVTFIGRSTSATLDTLIHPGCLRPASTACARQVRGRYCSTARRCNPSTRRNGPS